MVDHQSQRAKAEAVEEETVLPLEVRSGGGRLGGDDPELAGDRLREGGPERHRDPD